MATIPVNALTSNQSIVATPSIRIPAMAGFASVHGPLTNGTVESGVRSGSIGFNLTLRNETWVEVTSR